MSRIDKTATKFRPIARPKGPTAAAPSASARPGVRLGVGSGAGVGPGHGGAAGAAARRPPSVLPPVPGTAGTTSQQIPQDTAVIQSTGEGGQQFGGGGIPSIEDTPSAFQPSNHDRIIPSSSVPSHHLQIIREGEEDIPRHEYGTMRSAELASTPISDPSAPAPSRILPPPSAPQPRPTVLNPPTAPQPRPITLVPTPPPPPPPAPSRSMTAIPLSGPTPPQPRARIPPPPIILHPEPPAPTRGRTREPTVSSQRDTMRRGTEDGIMDTTIESQLSFTGLNPEQPGHSSSGDIQSGSSWRISLQPTGSMEVGEIPSVFGNVVPPVPNLTKKGRGKNKKKDVAETDGVVGEAAAAAGTDLGEHEIQPVKKKRAPSKKKVTSTLTQIGAGIPGSLHTEHQDVIAGPSEPKRPRGRPKKVIVPPPPEKRRTENEEDEDIASDDSNLGDFDPEGDITPSRGSVSGRTGTEKRNKRIKNPRNPNRIISKDAINDDSIVPGQALGPAIDSSALTMAEVAANPGKGRVSRRGLELEKRKKEEMRKRKETDKEGVDDDGVDREGSAPTEAGTEVVESRASRRAVERDFFSGAPPGETIVATVPQVREVNGELVLVHESTIIDHHARTLRNAENMETVEENDVDRFVNSASYQKKTKGPKWSEEETQLFLEKISEFGTDFQMIAYCFPGRNRNMIRRKYNTEMRLREERLDEAWSTRKEVDLDYVAKTMNINFNEPLETGDGDDDDGGVNHEGTRGTSPATTGGREGSPSRSSRAGSASTGVGGVGVGARGRQMMKKKVKKRSRSEMEEGVEIVGDVVAVR